ncbi:hypothetical protein MKEN_01265000 [Mycena kentingensis (nom. inval.)]|nr:hypothetical protein MKEN_01265000 [Mycena kentingensis (nom. inval.)]
MGWLYSLFFRPSSELYLEKFAGRMLEPDVPIDGLLEGTRTSYSIAVWMKKLQTVGTNENHWADLDSIVVDRVDQVRVTKPLFKKRSPDKSKVFHEAVAFEYRGTRTVAGVPTTLPRAALVHRLAQQPPIGPVLNGSSLVCGCESDAKDEVRTNENYEELGISHSRVNVSAKYRSERSLLAVPNLQPSQRRITALDMAILSEAVSDIDDKYKFGRTCMWYATVLYLAVQQLARVGFPDACLQRIGAPDAGAKILGRAFGVPLVDPVTGRSLSPPSSGTSKGAPGVLSNLDSNTEEPSVLADPQEVLNEVLAAYHARRKQVFETIRERTEMAKGRAGVAERRADEAERRLEREREENLARQAALEARIARERKEERSAWEREREDGLARQAALEVRMERERGEGLARQTALEAQMAQMALLLNRFLPPEPTRVEVAPSTGVPG